MHPTYSAATSFSTKVVRTTQYSQYLGNIDLTFRFAISFQFGASHGDIWLLVETQPAVVPEPASILAWGTVCALAVACCLRFRRHDVRVAA